MRGFNCEHQLLNGKASLSSTLYYLGTLEEVISQFLNLQNGSNPIIEKVFSVCQARTHITANPYHCLPGSVLVGVTWFHTRKWRLSSRPTQNFLLWRWVSPQPNLVLLPLTRSWPSASFRRMVLRNKWNYWTASAMVPNFFFFGDIIDISLY